MKSHTIQDFTQPALCLQANSKDIPITLEKISRSRSANDGGLLIIQPPYPSHQEKPHSLPINRSDNTSTNNTIVTLAIPKNSFLFGSDDEDFTASDFSIDFNQFRNILKCPQNQEKLDKLAGHGKNLRLSIRPSYCAHSDRNCHDYNNDDMFFLEQNLPKINTEESWKSCFCCCCESILTKNKIVTQKNKYLWRFIGWPFLICLTMFGTYTYHKLAGHGITKEKMAKLCDYGYHLAGTSKINGKSMSGNLCLENKCFCHHGTEAYGEDCVSHNSEGCTECDKGYELEGWKCVEPLSVNYFKKLVSQIHGTASKNSKKMSDKISVTRGN